MAHRIGPQEAEALAFPSARSGKMFYHLAEILVCDPVASNRAATRSALYSLGCHNIEIGGTLRDFLESLENRPPDVALCEAQVGEAELCDAIRELRHGRGYNPFAIIIITAWKPSATLVSQILAAGADGVILRPFSASVLDQRIRAHVLQRKPFIVTENYIGPERRSLDRYSEASSFEPPNSLLAKIESPERLDEAMRRFNSDLRTACEKLVAAKRRRSISQLRS